MPPATPRGSEGSAIEMGLGKKLDVEPLSEQRWSRIERELFERVANGEADAHVSGDARVPAAPRWRMAAALVLAGAAAAIGGARRVARAEAPASRTAAAIVPSRITTDAAGSHVNVGEADARRGAAVDRRRSAATTPTA